MFALIGFGILCYTGVRHRLQGPRHQPEPRRRLPDRQRLGRPGRAPPPRSWRPTSSTRSRTRVTPSRASSRSPPPRARARPTSPSSSSIEPQHRRRAAGRPDQGLPGQRTTCPARSTRRSSRKTNPEDQPIMRLALSGDRPPTFLADYVRNVIRPQFQTIDGVGEIDVFGFRDRNVRVWYDAGPPRGAGPHRARRQRAPSSASTSRCPAGRIEGAEREMNVRAEGEAIDIEAFRDLVVTYRNGAPVRLQGRRGGRGRPRGPPPPRPRHGRDRRSASASPSCAAPTPCRSAATSRPRWSCSSSSSPRG